MLKRLFFLVVAMVLLVPAVAFCADAVEIDPSVVYAIAASGLLGFGVIAVTQIIKTALRLSGSIVSFGVSLIVSAAAVVVFLITGGGGFNLLKFVGYTVAVWAVSNGWYKFKSA